MTAVVLALGSIVVMPSIASAATDSVSSSLTTSQPKYTHNVTRSSDNYPCAPGSEATHYRSFRVLVTGTGAVFPTVTVTPTGFRANLASHDPFFKPEDPVSGCNGDTAGAESGSPVTYTTGSVAVLPPYTERFFEFAVAGYSVGDLGSFTLSATSSNATSVTITEVTPQPPADTTKPVLSGLTDVTREATKSTGADVTFAPTADDAVDGSRPVTCSPASGSTFGIGTTTVSCSATDLSSNQATGSFGVTVRDTTGPALTVAAPAPTEATGPDGAPVTFSASASDAVDGTRPVTCSPASGSTFPIGTTEVSCSATDTRTNPTSKQIDVVVRDTTKPTVLVPDDIREQATSNSGANVSFGWTIVDRVSGVDGSTMGCTRSAGSLFPIGTTTVTCSGADNAGNIGSGSFDITVYKGTLAVSGSVTVTGDALVGKTLTAASSVATTPASSGATGQWLRDGTPIASATATTYLLTAADLDKTITYKRTDVLGGYDDVVSTSNAMGPIDEGEIALAEPTISGTAQVGKTLTVVPGSVTPSDASLTYEWFAGADSLGTGTTYVIEPADVGRTIRVEATAAKTAYETATETSAARPAVVPGVLAVTGAVEVTGDALVGRTLTATSTVATTPATSSPTGQWFRGTVPITDADEAAYVLTNADAGAELTYVETRATTGYVTVTTTSEPTAKISGGIISVSDPVVTGDATVDQVLTASVSGVDPADAETTFEWFVGSTTAGSGASYTVKPADVGRAINVAATTAKPYFDPITATSVNTSTVQRATFVTGPSAAITGVFKVGEELTAETGTPSPAQDAFTYVWFADGDPIGGENDKTFALTAAQKDKAISVEVTAVRAGYVEASDTSDVSATVVTNLAPDLSLTPSAAELRLGQSTTLSWTSLDAVTVEASGSWTGAKAPKGSETVTPSATGTATYILRATNGSGSTTAQVAVPVALPAKKLTLAAKSSVRSDKRLTVKASGLAPGEKYTLRLGGKLVTTGQATSAGRVERKVRVPSSVKAGTRTLRMTGSLADRTATRKVKVVRVKALAMVLTDSSVRASDRQRVTVSRLLPGEKVTVTYQGKRISQKSARANRRGVFTMTFNVDLAWGKKTVNAVGASDKRSASKTFTVVNRCPQGGYYCR